MNFGYLTFRCDGGNVVFEQDRNAMKFTALARRLSFLVKGCSLSKSGRVGLNDSTKLGSLEVDFVNTREVRFDEVYACEVTSI